MSRSRGRAIKIDDLVYVSNPKIGNINLDEDLSYSLSEALKEDAERATTITIVSGYFRPDAIINILSARKRANRSTTSIEIIVGFDRTMGDGLTQTHFAGELEKKIVKLGFLKRNVKVRVLRDSVHLHTKLFGFVKTTAPVWYVGSANASGAIDGDRHELMMRLQGRSESLNAYVKALRNACAGGVSKEVLTVPELLSRGLWVFRPSRQISLTFEAYELDREARRKLSGVLGRDTSVPHSDPSAEGFGFNLLSALGMESRQSGKNKATFSFRRYCVETDYGYWAPREFRDELERGANRAEEHERSFLENVGQKLYTTPDEKILRSFEEYLRSAAEYFKRSGVTSIKKATVEDSFANFLSVRRQWLSNSDWIAKAASRATISPMPDIWRDVRTSSEFIQSFFDDISLRLNSPGRRGMIYNRLKKNLGLEANTQPEDIRNALEETLMTGKHRKIFDE